jgi:hypothetical protein
MRAPASKKFGTMLVVMSLSLPFDLFAQKETRGDSPEVRVPFVGCASDGQVGPLEAPKGTNKVVRLAPDTAQRLTYYQAERGPGVLGPRGWYCFGVYGSNGAQLFVSPIPHNPSDFFAEKWDGFDGPAIDVSGMSGSTSGRFSVAKVVARVFPTEKKFVEQVIAEGIEPASEFPFGPYPQDKLVYLSPKVVEFRTPPHAEGLGTRSWLRQNNSAIDGVEILQNDGDHDLVSLSARLPSTMNDRTFPIIHQIERDAPLP